MVARELTARVEEALRGRDAALGSILDAAVADPQLSAAASIPAADPGMPAARAAAFRALTRLLADQQAGLAKFGSDDAGLVLLDKEGQAVAWAGRTFEVDEGLLAGDAPRSAIQRGPTYGRIASGRRIGDFGAVVGFLTIEVEYPFRNRYLAPRRVLEEAIGVPGVEVRLSAPRPGRPPDPEEATEGPFVVRTEGAARAAEERTRTDRERRRALWTTCLLLLSLGVIAFQLPRMRGSRPARALLGAAALAAARVACDRFGLGSALLPPPLVDEVAYAGPWAANPGDLLLSTLAACAVALLLAWGLAPPVEPPGSARRRRAARACLLLLPAAAWYAIHAVTSLAASVVQDGTIPLFEGAGDLLGPVRLSLDLSILLAATAGLAGTRLAGLWAAWGARGLPPRVVLPVSLLLLTAAALAATPSAGAAAFAIAAVLPAAMGPAVAGRGIAWVLLPLCAALLVFPPLDSAQARNQWVLLDQRGKELSNPAHEARVAATMDLSLEAITATPWLPAELERISSETWTPSPRLALSLWQESDLARKGEDCYLGVRCDKHPDPDSEFSFGLPREWLGANPFQQEGNDGLVAPHDVPFRRAQIRNAEGRVVGEVLLAVLPRYRAAAPGGRASLLRVEPGSSKGVVGLVLTEYRDGRLTASESSEAPVPPVLPAGVLRDLESGPSWRTETVEDRTWQTMFVLREGASRLVYALSRRLPTAFERFQSFLRFFLVFVLAGGAVGALVIAARALRGRAPIASVLGRLQVQLFASFVLLGLVPIVALAVVHQRLRSEEAGEEQDAALRRVVDVAARECVQRQEEMTEREVRETGRAAGSLEYVLETHAQELAGAAARVAGLDVILYSDGEHVGTSRPELFQTELLPTRMDEEAFREVFLLGRETHVVTRPVGDYQLRIGYQRLAGGPTRRTYGVVAVPELAPSPGGPRPFDSTVTLVFGIYGLVVTAVWLGSAAISRRIAAPVESMTLATRRAAAGDLSGRVPAVGTGELAALVDSFNKMLEDLEHGREALAKAEREAAWRGMARQIAHEIKNPLTPLKLSAQHLARAYADGAPGFAKLLEECVEMIVQQVDLLGRIASDFSYFAKLPDRRPQETDLNELALGCAQLFSSTIEGRIETKLSLAEGLPALWLDSDEWRRVLTNLIKNAIEAMEAGGVLSIETERGETVTLSKGTGRRGGRIEQATARPWVELRIRDTGPGLPEEVREKVFQPYITTKPNGTGLGLAIVKKSVDDAGGTITLESAPGRGTTVRVRIPYGPGTPVALPADRS